MYINKTLEKNSLCYLFVLYSHRIKSLNKKMIPTLRTLTRKSKLGFGKYKYLTVQKILDMKMPLVLISPYYKLSSINYIEDILTELKITEQYIIKKPSINKEMYYKFLKENGFKLKERGKGPDKLKLKTKQLTKSQLQSKNHGR